MRVMCSTIRDFIENLRPYSASQVYQQRIYLEKSESPMDDANPATAVKFTIRVQATCVIQAEEQSGGGEYLLAAGEDCGIDYRDSSLEFAGSDKAAEVKQILEDYCRANGLTILPGIAME